MMRVIVPVALVLLSFLAGAPPEKEDQYRPKSVPKPIDIENDPPKVAPKPVEPTGAIPGTGVLVVGVRQLPELMSPNFARNEAERAACELLFESLVRSKGEGQYEPGLAATMPAVVPLGREFELSPEAAWVDPATKTPIARVVAADVMTSFERCRQLGIKPGGEVGEWFGDLYSDTANRVRITLRQGHADPLSLMTIPILPNNRPDDEAFARAPIGSGPFVYSGRVTEGGRTYAVFAANPNYGQRGSRKNLPQLKEIRFVASADPANDFRRGTVDVLLGAATPDLVGLTTQPTQSKSDEPMARITTNLGSSARVITRPTRRINYLAVNHVKLALGGDPGRALRRGLAFGIRREEILNAVYRGGIADMHRALSGPFPAGTWPIDAKTAITLDDPAKAQAGLAGSTAPLTLKYPNDDPQAAKACDLIKRQINDLKAGVTIDLIALPPSELAKQVDQQRDYDLAWRTFEYRDDWFDVAGLLAPRATGPGGRNVLGLPPSDRLEAALTRTSSLREFSALRTAQQRLAEEFHVQMPFIPLWSLDAHIVLKKSVKTEPAAEALDPQAVFRSVEHWRVVR